MVWGVGCEVGGWGWGLGFGVWGLWSRVQGLGFGFWGLGFEVLGLPAGAVHRPLFRDEGSGFQFETLITYKPCSKTFTTR